MGLYSRDRRSEAAAQWQRHSEALQVHSLVAGFFPNWDASAVGLRILLEFHGKEVELLKQYARHKGRRIHYGSLSGDPVLARVFENNQG